MKKASHNQPAYAWILLLCYAVMLWVSAFHTHDCRHGRDDAEGATAGAFHVNKSGQFASLSKAFWFNYSGCSEAYDEHCCVHSGLRDCDQTEFFPRHRLAVEEGRLEGLFVGLLPFTDPESGFGVGSASGEPLLSTLSPLLTSIRSIRLLI